MGYSIPSDRYFNNRKHFRKMKEYGMDVCPVDANGAYVPEDKWDPTNPEETQESLNDRFDLASEGDYGMEEEEND